AAIKERDKDVGDHGKKAEAMIAQAHAEAAKAQMELYAYQISQSTIRAPYDGILLKGDLTTRIGQKLQLGEELHEMAPNDRLRVEAKVAERDIQNVKLGAAGRLATDALPMDKYTFHVSRIIPVAKAEEGASEFVVYGEPDSAEAAEGHPDWRPGMAGEIRIDVGHKRLAWIWTHRLIDFLRLKLWM
ncbi:MAG TPA: HlyD family secretion protein, partial [Tepidisphaeraceae bacterium]|nr:HlyD family secretion protein [Tepidisphaeraceae bacterium]